MVFPLIPLSCLTPFVRREIEVNQRTAALPFGSTSISLARALVCGGIDAAWPESER